MGFQKGHKINLGRKHTKKRKSKKIEVICRYCGTHFKVYPYQIKRGNGECCSGSCAKKLIWLNKDFREKMYRARKGKCGVYKRTKEDNIKNSEGHKGIKRSKKSRKKQSETMTGKKRFPHSEETKIKLREATITQLSSGKMQLKNTSIELKIEEELKIANLNYQKQVAICKVGVVDFLLPDYNIIIQADGLYWHSSDKVKKRDATQDLVYSLNEFKVFRFCESEINKSPRKCIKAVLKYIKWKGVNKIGQNKATQTMH